MSSTNKQYLLKDRPKGLPTADDFDFITSTIPEPKAGEVLIKVLYISLDPAMRGWMNASRSYVPPVRLGQVMRAGTAGVVVASKNEKFKEGDYVTGLQGVQEYGISKGEDLLIVDPQLAPLPTHLGALGMPGMTAYFGLLDVGAPQADEIVLVSGAAGAVGSLVGQIANIKGCTTGGIAGGPEKCEYLTSLGFDFVMDYKNEELFRSIKRNCKKGFDIYFDNVGGDILDAAMANIRRGARIVLCGAISQYNLTEVVGPKYYMNLLVHRARMEGFVVFDYADRYQEAVTEMAGWIKDGRLQTREHIEDDLERFPEVLLKLFDGSNHGKLALKVAEG